MSSSHSTVAAPLAEARPVDDTERLILLDALRGFALCGVFVSNTYMWFSGRFLLTRAQIESFLAQASLADLVTTRGTAFLVFGKFITLFSFLFGLGFAVQMGRAEQRGGSIVPLYARRVGVLVLIGLAHGWLLWFGDILSTYAVLGFTLLLFRKRSDKTLLIWSAVLIFLVPLLIENLPRLKEIFGSTADAEAAAKVMREQREAVKAQVLVGFQSNSYFDLVRANALFYKGFLQGVFMTMPSILGRFLLGLVAGRHRIFHEPSKHLPLLRKVLIWGLITGIIGNGSSTVMSILFAQKILNPDTLPWLPFVMWPVRQIGELGLAAFYVTGITLLFQRATWQRVLSVLAPVGRMALSNYLSQTVLSLFIWYGIGLGLTTTLGPKVTVVLPLGIFAIQVILSHLWLARFRFGPAEWVWRSLTYGKAQPLRRAPTPEPSAATAV
ncbi:DUF418 domain-containing protein [Hyalangium minutum]|uniref:DUF418 domain-containing protein n=1 Tax=Hyalangium minutum TaxID=394096 RepID=A0A085WGE9_9BACT|nr:DUF418 domain-containing protein [Hyalangium minutum]KFE66762.1 hypothetical protein DB31_8976 [Hyalangium minutum]